MDSINQTDVISYFERVNGLISKHMQLNWQTFILDLLNSSRVDKVTERKDGDCQVEYKFGSPEITLGDLAILSTSWILEILKRKTQDGHCQNIEHEHGRREPRNCMKGYEFHLQMYRDFLSSIRDLVNVAENNPPKEFTDH